jgi:hypothetical protein
MADPQPPQPNDSTKTAVAVAAVGVKQHEKTAKEGSASDSGVSDSEKKSVTYKKVLTDFFEIKPIQYTAKVAIESAHLSPYVFIAGSLIYSLLTLNFSILIFGLTMIEAYFIRWPISSLFSYYTAPGDISKNSMKEQCSSEYHVMSPPILEAFIKKGVAPSIPHPSLYGITVAFTYIFASMLKYSDELSALGPSYSNRPYLSFAAGCMFLTLFSVYLLSYECITSIHVIATVLLGVLIGFGLFFQNNLLSGDTKTVMNVMFIPTLAKNTPTYVCARVSTNS